ncbi:RnfABCDGE type electron transport complex subunit D [Miniphocaeibacter halophilus]|uniref:RnfABCDGE type electron transport complex subunit D n=1 Tax=Miniphocaeibacter halophilus TaxID=2931922 RepID=A0AC61MSX1_9FIRM|nr:RnfABCDGE type electron transport complex subunit D [Miniphocaeibacter halophilus]QQK08646.1 RnfABCDGE type electron transport complex subunit D [Miniphocaeibacter halophilus]
MKNLYEKYFTKQKMMRTVLIPLIIISLFSIYNFGWRVLALLLLNLFVAMVIEYLCEVKLYKRKKISEAVIITSILYTMTLPVSLPFWISAVGIAFGIFFGKMVFGGFGKNIFNPALVGRVFIYINFPNPLTIAWNEAAKGLPGGFGAFTLPHIDALSTATPMLAFRNEGVLTNISDLLIGNVSGAIGETSKVLIILAAIYLIYKKVASWQIMAGSVLGFSVLSGILNLMGVETIPNPIYGMLLGGFLLGTVFMATDPISAAKTVPGKWIYGLIIGIVTVIIRGFALFSGGMMFAILMGNTFAPIIDYVVRQRKANKKSKEAVV